MSCLVVGGDSNIDEFQGSIGVAESDDGDVDVGGFTDSLVVNTGIGDDDETGFLERPCDVVSEGTGGESSGNGLCASVGGVFEDSTVSVGAGRDNANIVGVFDGSDDTSSEDELLPGLSNVQDVDTWIEYMSGKKWSIPSTEVVRTISTSLPNVGLHLLVTVFGTDVALGSEQELNLLLSRAQDGW